MKKKVSKRSRPVGSKNKKATTKKVNKKTDLVKTKKRGRPIGSKNQKRKKTDKKPLREIVLHGKTNNNLNIEIWRVHNNVYKIYAENKEFLEKLSKNINSNICAFYMDEKGKEFAWDVFFDKKDLNYVQKICKEIK